MENEVFPTRVGVFLGGLDPAQQQARLPHTRGGVSAPRSATGAGPGSSPHAWGCFQVPVLGVLAKNVFPTRVGVFPHLSRGRIIASGLPHTRGGVSTAMAASFHWSRSSPHAWGCFRRPASSFCSWRVFPTRVGVFPASRVRRYARGGLPHTRGGVSHRLRAAGVLDQSSPHAWGCFRIGSQDLRVAGVFPTRVGVFPRWTPTAASASCLPHTRGGVSEAIQAKAVLTRSSPHAWGCFSRPSQPSYPSMVFPTRVGVFLRRSTARAAS